MRALGPSVFGRRRSDEGEDIEIVELGFDEAFSMIDQGEILDAKTLILLQRLAMAVDRPGTSVGNSDWHLSFRPSVLAGAPTLGKCAFR